MTNNILKMHLIVEPKASLLSSQDNFISEISNRDHLKLVDSSVTDDGMIFSFDISGYDNEETAYKFLYDELFEITNAVIANFDSFIIKKAE